MGIFKTFKAFTDIEQSKKLAEILPVKSADMVYIDAGYCSRVLPSNDIDANSYPTICPCWSLAALLNILSNMAYSIDEDASVGLSSYKDVEWDLSICNSGLDSATKSDPIDACVEMILKLHEQKLL